MMRLAVATGKYISMLASDDIWLPDKIASQVKLMESLSDQVGVLYSDAFQMDRKWTYFARDAHCNPLEAD